MQTIQNQLIREIRRLGLPVEFALVLAGELKTEKMIGRMVGDLRHMEYYNARYNRYLNEK